MAKKLEGKKKKSRQIKIICLTFGVLLYTLSRLYLTHEFRHACLNTYFQCSKGIKLQLFHQRKRKCAPQFLSPYYLFIVLRIYILVFFFFFFLFLFIFLFYTEKMENSFHLNSQSPHAQSNTKTLDRN